MDKYLRADLHHGRRWLGAAAFTLVAVLFAALVPFDSEPPWPGRWDKTLHALSFMLLMIVCCGPLAKRLRISVFLLLLLCGVMIELIQIPLPGRREEWGDLLADFIGLLAGFALLRFGLDDWCRQLERRLGLQ